MRALAIVLALLAGLLATGGPTLADSEQERARAAMQSGEVRPFQEILRHVRRRFDGRVLDARLVDAGNRQWVYEIKMMKRNGSVFLVVVDGRSGQIIDVVGGG